MSDLRTLLAGALGPIYRVEREVRPVGEYRQFVVTTIPTGPALLVKVVPAATSLAIDAQRFERDILLLAERLRHPNLVAPKGAGRAGSFIYHTRPFVAGTTLHAWIAKNGQLPLARVVEIIRGILAGLAHAHSQGLAHGDLGTEYVLLGEDGVCIADVGLRRVLGHVASPRNDMADFVRLMYEMLTGEAPREDGEPLERTRALPPWLGEWARSQWSDAGNALAAFRPPPPPPPSFNQEAPQPFA
jgi:serine/threonine-protein kinase